MLDMDIKVNRIWLSSWFARRCDKMWTTHNVHVTHYCADVVRAPSVPLIIAVCCVHRFIFPASSQTQESVVGFARTCEVAQLGSVCTENCIPFLEKAPKTVFLFTFFEKKPFLNYLLCFSAGRSFIQSECIFMMIHVAIIIEEKLSFQLYFAKRIDQYLIHLIIQRNELSAPVWSSSSSSRWWFKSSWLEQPSAGQDQEPQDDFWQ